MNDEVLQIYPNYFYVLKINRSYCLSKECVLISEAIRRLGGKLIKRSGEKKVFQCTPSHVLWV